MRISFSAEDMERADRTTEKGNRMGAPYRVGGYEGRQPSGSYEH